MSSTATYAILVTVQFKEAGPSVSEVPTGTGVDANGNPQGEDPVGSAGGGTPLLNKMLLSEKWSIQSIQQLAQAGAGGTPVNLFLLVKNSQ